MLRTTGNDSSSPGGCVAGSSDGAGSRRDAPFHEEGRQQDLDCARQATCRWDDAEDLRDWSTVNGLNKDSRSLANAAQLRQSDLVFCFTVRCEYQVLRILIALLVDTECHRIIRGPGPLVNTILIRDTWD